MGRTPTHLTPKEFRNFIKTRTNIAKYVRKLEKTRTKNIVCHNSKPFFITLVVLLLFTQRRIKCFWFILTSYCYSTDFVHRVWLAHVILWFFLFFYSILPSFFGTSVGRTNIQNPERIPKKKVCVWQHPNERKPEKKSFVRDFRVFCPTEKSSAYVCLWEFSVPVNKHGTRNR